MSAAAVGLSARIVVAREHFAVDVEVRVASGETVAVMGPSGAGKSTLLQALAGFVPLDEGEIAVEGQVVDRVAAPRVRTEPMQRGIVLLGQNPRLFPHLSVRENVAFGPRAAGVPVTDARRGADDWIARVGLPGAGDRRPHELSGGEAQRVAVARALAAAPRVVLLDEPLVALDPETAGDIRRMLRDQLDGVTTVAVTHDAADAVALADRLIVLEAGRVTQEGAVREVLAAPASGFVASIAGVNRIEGVSAGGGWRKGELVLSSTESASRALAAHDGVPLTAIFRPQDVQIIRSGEWGPGDGWRARIIRLEPTLAGIRVHTDLCQIDVALADTAGLVAGEVVRLRIDPAGVRFVSPSQR
ncbi:sulfate/molybdate ABC transporter ATP-binding protein [Microbacterium maritypicum]